VSENGSSVNLDPTNVGYRLARQLWGPNKFIWKALGLSTVGDSVVTEFSGDPAQGDRVDGIRRLVKLGSQLAPVQVWLARERSERPTARLLIGSAAPDKLVFATFRDNGTAVTVTREPLERPSRASQ
jgi:hypothetical protein